MDPRKRSRGTPGAPDPPGDRELVVRQLPLELYRPTAGQVDQSRELSESGSAGRDPQVRVLGRSGRILRHAWAPEAARSDAAQHEKGESSRVARDRMDGWH